ncbi:hypothetical protein QYM36_014208, partial [Artemia franciscana]
KFYAVEGQESSQSYIIKLLTVSVSTIAYMKNLYNEDDYAEFPIKGGNCKVLKVKSENPDCKHLLGMLKGAFDAIRKQYTIPLVDNEDMSTAKYLKQALIASPSGLEESEIGVLQEMISVLKKGSLSRSGRNCSITVGPHQCKIL